MIVEDSYYNYSQQLSNDYQSSLQYRGEFIARNMHPEISCYNSFWILWDKEDGLECCHIKKQGDSYSINSIISMPDFLKTNNIINNVLSQESCIEWLNLCHFRASDGKVHYDRFYDKYPVEDSTDRESMNIGEMRETVKEDIKKYLPFGKNEVVIIDGRLRQYNFISEILQGMEITPITASHNDSGIKKDSMECTSTDKLSLYTVTADSTIVIPMPVEREILVYKEHTDDNAGDAATSMQLMCANCDMLGNIWVTTKDVYGKISCDHRIKSEINYSVTSD